MKSKRNRRPPRFRSGRTAPKFPGPNQAWRPPRRCALAARSRGPRRARPRSPRARAGENPGPGPTAPPPDSRFPLGHPLPSRSQPFASRPVPCVPVARQVPPAPPNSLRSLKPPEQARVEPIALPVSLLFKYVILKPICNKNSKCSPIAIVIASQKACFASLSYSFDNGRILTFVLILLISHETCFILIKK